jgi:hypothetical protein
MTGRLGAILLVAAIVAGCATEASPSAAASSPLPTAQATTASAAPTPPDLSARPLLWFAPLPPMPTGPGRPYIGSEDFMDLFAAGAAWDLASERIGVFKLYGEWVAYHATDAQLRTAVEEIARRGLALAVEMGPLDPPPTCGEGVESFAGIDEGRLITSRIRRAGGTLQVIALDEPYYFAHLYGGPNACHWPVEQIAEAVAGFTEAMREDWPGLIVGDTEPMPAPVSPDGLAGWLDAYAAAAGEPLAFLHLDVDWSRPDWPELGLAVEAAGRERDVPIGMIYNGGAATSDAQWLALAGRRVLAYETDAGGQPDHVLFQSWMDKPDRALPETDPASFTGFVNRYLDDPASLGELVGGSANLALERPATASSQLVDAHASRAVDGDPDTIWSAGAGPPAWIEIDLGSAQPIGEVRLQVSQFPNGATHHRVSCAAAPGAALTPLGELTGETADVEVLTLSLAAPVSCHSIRIDTLASPSWVAWREIEVLGP